MATVPAGTSEDVDLAIVSARKAFKSGVWARMEPRARMEVLYRLANLIDEHALKFALLDSLDVGKPVFEMLTGDVPAAALTFRYFGETIDKLEGVVTNTAADAFHYILRQPLGVVACITPWNYPLLMNAWNVAPALAAGNSVVLKPAERSPLSATLLAQLFVEAGAHREYSKHRIGLGTGQKLIDTRIIRDKLARLLVTYPVVEKLKVSSL